MHTAVTKVVVQPFFGSRAGDSVWDCGNLPKIVILVFEWLVGRRHRQPVHKGLRGRIALGHVRSLINMQLRCMLTAMSPTSWAESTGHLAWSSLKRIKEWLGDLLTKLDRCLMCLLWWVAFSELCLTSYNCYDSRDICIDQRSNTLQRVMVQRYSTTPVA